MSFNISFNINSTLFIKDPQSSEIGKSILISAVDLLHEIGLEQFTIKKLAQQINTTEATIYRYFENKFKIFLYLMNVYWQMLDFIIEVKLQNLQTTEEKIDVFLKVLCYEYIDIVEIGDISREKLLTIAMNESSKTYLLRAVDEINTQEAYHALKIMVLRFHDLLITYNPNYKYPHSLAASVFEIITKQMYFEKHLPTLTDQKFNQEFTVYDFIRDLVYKSIDPK
ncbi:MAG: TetR/AcrR family transcriptional regulator [Chitinophagales bacterium]|jgi:AcrR family transcriptional regulator|nr:TetR/AcrR family transcriptional regulator [Chitinophagales bacterium]